MTKFFTLTTSQPVKFCNSRLDGAIATRKFAVEQGHNSLGTITRLRDGILPGRGYAMQDNRQSNSVQGNFIMPFMGNLPFTGSDRAANRRDLSVAEFSIARYQLDGSAHWQRRGGYRCRGIVPIKG